MKQSQLIILSLALLILTNCQNKGTVPTSAPPADNSNAQQKNWSEQMQSLGNTLDNLLPFVHSTKSFNDPQNQTTIDNLVKQLSGLSHNVSKKQSAITGDPTLFLVANDFNESITRSIKALEEGHRDYARNELKYITSYCIQCHTKDNMGPSFGTTKMNDSLKKLNPLEKSEFLIATRQFDSALNEIETILKAPLSKTNNIITLDKASRYAMLITIRYQNDPNKAQKFTEIILKNDSTPYFLREAASSWVKSLKEWKSEPKGNNSMPSSKILLAKSLINKAQKNSNFNTDHSGDVYYLRASSLLHESLNASLIGEIKSEALYYLGLSYEAIRDLNLSNLQDNFFEQCIRTSPKTTISKKCYKKYEESILFGFSGSAGLSIPDDVQNKLSELRILATGN